MERRGGISLGIRWQGINNAEVSRFKKLDELFLSQSHVYVRQPLRVYLRYSRWKEVWEPPFCYEEEAEGAAAQSYLHVELAPSFTRLCSYQPRLQGRFVGHILGMIAEAGLASLFVVTRKSAWWGLRPAAFQCVRYLT